MEIRALKDQVIKILEEKHYKASVAQLDHLEMVGHDQMDPTEMEADDLTHPPAGQNEP